MVSKLRISSMSSHISTKFNHVKKYPIISMLTTSEHTNTPTLRKITLPTMMPSKSSSLVRHRGFQPQQNISHAIYIFTKDDDYRYWTSSFRETIRYYWGAGPQDRSTTTHYPHPHYPAYNSLPAPHYPANNSLPAPHYPAKNSLPASYYPAKNSCLYAYLNIGICQNKRKTGICPYMSRNYYY